MQPVQRSARYHYRDRSSQAVHAERVAGYHYRFNEVTFGQLFKLEQFDCSTLKYAEGNFQLHRCTVIKLNSIR